MEGGGEKGFFSFQFFFHCGIAEEGKGFFFFTNSLWGEGLVESGYFQNY